MNKIVETEKAIYLLLLSYLRDKDKLEEIQLKELQDKFTKEIEKQDKRMERFKLELQHPELFRVISPKEYGQQIKRRKRK